MIIYHIFNDGILTIKRKKLEKVKQNQKHDQMLLNICELLIEKNTTFFK